jgi:hypothetical protein
LLLDDVFDHQIVRVMIRSKLAFESNRIYFDHQKSACLDEDLILAGG